MGVLLEHAPLMPTHSKILVHNSSSNNAMGLATNVPTYVCAYYKHTYIHTYLCVNEERF